MTYRAGSSRSYPWGVETDIHIEDGGVVLRTVTVTQWPDDPVAQEARGNHLMQNYLDDQAEAT